MTIRQIAFSVAASGAVSPALPQYGGVKGEHNETALCFSVDAALVTANDVMRLAFTGGDGAVLSSDLIEDYEQTADAITFSYVLPQILTLPAGQLCARVVVSRFDDDGNEIEIFRSNEAVVWFDEAEVENGTPFWTGVSEMLRRTVTAKDTAVEAQEAAHAAQAQAQAAAASAKTYVDEMRPAAIRVMNALSDAEKARSEAQTAAGKAVTSQQGASHFAAVAEECAAQAAAARDSVVSPHIGENGNWFIGETDTGVKAGGDGTVTNEQIAAAVEAYLTEHPVQGGGCKLTVETITIGEVPVTGIELDYSTMNINEGESFQLAATVYPANATNNVVRWRTSNASIATVADGYVTGVSGGTVTITAYADDNNSITATCTVTVAAESGGGNEGGEIPDIPDIPDEPAEPDTPVEPTDGKVYFSTLTPVNTGVMLKKDGVTELSNSACYGYFKIPYTDGMVVSTVISANFAGNYPPIMVIENGVVTVPTTENTVLAGQITNYVATLTGFSDNAEVVVNVTNCGTVTYPYKELQYCYYIAGGAE